MNLKLSTMHFKKLTYLPLLLALVSLAACSSTEKKKDVKPVEKGPTRAEKLGLTDKALQSFEVAAQELAKEKPDTQKALDALKVAVKENPEFAEAQYNLGLLYLQLDQLEDAAAALEVARNADPDVQVYAVALGRAYAGLKRYDEARTLFEDVIAREPDNLTAKNNLAVLELMRDKTDEAITILQEILREDPKNVAALNTMGRVYRRAKKLSLARYVYEEKALKVEPENADLHNNLGLVFLDLKQVPQAVTHFEKAVEYNPNHAEAHMNLGTIVLEYLDYKRAEGEFEEAVRVLPANCEARLGLAASKYAVSSYQDAADQYNYYIDNCDKNHISAHERLAKLYQSQLNEPDKAIAEYRILISLTNDDKKRTGYEAMAGFLESQKGKATQAPPPEAPKDEETEGDDASEEANQDDAASQDETSEEAAE